jgi:hypothetical protein
MIASDLTITPRRAIASLRVLLVATLVIPIVYFAPVN